MDFVILIVAAVAFIITYIVVANLWSPWTNAPPGNLHQEIHIKTLRVQKVCVYQGPPFLPFVGSGFVFKYDRKLGLESPGKFSIKYRLRL